MIDLHSHILPGVDDGARTVEEARDLARQSVAEGVTAMAATPHVRADYPTSPVTMERAVAALRQDLEAESVPLDILHGGEISLALLWEVPPPALARFTLSQTGKYLLVEFPSYEWPRSLDLAISSLRGLGVRAILAHPERNPQVQDRPDRLAGAVRSGALVQVTSGSIDGRLDAASQRTAEHLLELGLVHLLASDAHGPHIRHGGLAAAASTLGDAALARYLTETVPAAIVAGKELPPRPG